MALVWNPHSELIREPNLLVAGKKPVGSVKVQFPYRVLDTFLFKTIKSPGTLNYTTTEAGTISVDPSKGIIASNGTLIAQNDQFTLSGASYTILCIADISSFDNWGGLYNKSDSTGSGTIYGLQRHSSGTTLDVYHGGSGKTLTTLSTTTLINAGLFKLVLRYNGAHISVWLDGELIEHTAFSSDPVDVGSARMVFFGERTASTSTGCDGYMESFTTFDGALPDSTCMDLTIDPYQFLIPA